MAMSIPIMPVEAFTIVAGLALCHGAVIAQRSQRHGFMPNAGLEIATWIYAASLACKIAGYAVVFAVLTAARCTEIVLVLSVVLVRCVMTIAGIGARHAWQWMRVTR
jgi:hypothetical protein